MGCGGPSFKLDGSLDRISGAVGQRSQWKARSAAEQARQTSFPHLTEAEAGAMRRLVRSPSGPSVHLASDQA